MKINDNISSNILIHTATEDHKKNILNIMNMKNSLHFQNIFNRLKMHSGFQIDLFLQSYIAENWVE